ncbi:MAG TPA: class I SAM-dependent methyltransferase [Solirubrobacteraceae bacterium]|nr:class I SAM-dependent methyltransferase [Solirubrobacteraceae bacterium]
MWLDPDLYEIENADDPGFDLGFWESVVQETAPRRILELACGTGRVTLPLARLGVADEIVALDQSAPFLQRLGERLAVEDEAVRNTVRAVEGDMRRPPLDGEFDLIIVPFNSLSYLITREDRVACLDAVRTLLARDGTFAFDIMQPRFDFLAESAQPCPPLRVDVDHGAPDHGVTRFLRSYSDVYDPRTQTLRSTNRYEIHYASGRTEHRIGDIDWHMYFPEELELLLGGAGLTVTERFGDYDRSPWEARSRLYLWVTKPR